MAIFNTNGINYSYALYPYVNGQLTLALSGPAASTMYNNFVITNEAWRSRLFDHAAQTNPTLWIHSNVDPDVDNTQWLRLYHNQTDAQIEGGTGTLSLDAGSGVRIGNAAWWSGTMAPGTLNVSVGMECEGDAYFKYLRCCTPNGSCLGGIVAYLDDGMQFWCQEAINYGNNHFIFTGESNKSKNHGHGSLSDDPTVFIHSRADVDTVTTQWISFAHDTTDALISTGTGAIKLVPNSGVTEITGIGVKTKQYYQTVNNGASFSLPAGSGLAMFQYSDAAEMAWFGYSSTATMLDLGHTAGVSYADTAGKMCFFDGGTTITVKNRTGSAQTLMGTITYV